MILLVFRDSLLLEVTRKPIIFCLELVRLSLELGASVHFFADSVVQTDEEKLIFC